ncbi:MAG: hypothetical protein FWF49_01275 [Oscillospiraceae bacterium]|nr:hypothetical protein [Oscillospiraceae bacterium]
MTKVTINPGVCGFVTAVEAVSEDGMEVKLRIKSGCEPVRKITKELGDTFDSYELCLVKPGQGPLFAYAGEKFPVHCGCPVLSGIVKAVEAECHLALPRDVSITFDTGAAVSD